MAIHKSVLKRARQSEIKRIENMAHRSRARNLVKDLRGAMADNDVEKARETLPKAIAVMQKTASKGIFHKKKASRTVSRLTRQVNRLIAEKSA